MPNHAPVTLGTTLDDITENFVINEHANQIELARQIYSHSIEVLTTLNDNRRYNCVMFALSIECDHEYLNMAYLCPISVHANTAFIQFLSDSGYIVERSSSEPKSLAVYLNNGQVKHIGRVMDNGRVQSKWGLGHLYEHAIFETPAAYGNAVCFFAPIERDIVLDAFFEFAKLHGVSFEN